MNQLSAIQNTLAHPKMSKRYVTIPTSEVIDIMHDIGFVISDQQQDKIRKGDPSYAKHMVTFRNPDLQTPDGTYVPQAIWLNSYNGTSRATLRLGVYRFVCSNGLVVGTDYMSDSVKHCGDLAKSLIERIKEMSKQTVDVFSTIDKWNKVQLTTDQRVEFAKQAMLMRFGEQGVQRFDVRDVLTPRRAEDDNGDLWSTFNIIQENTVKGGLHGVTSTGRRVSSKPLKSIGLNVGYNEKLWSLAESFA